MRLWELFEDLSNQEIKGVEARLNRQVYMPPQAVKNGAAVLKLNLPANQHFGDKAAGDRGYDQNYTADELQDLLARARTDPSLGYAHQIADFASYSGTDDFDPHGHGYKIKDPQTGLMIPFVVKPNPAAKKIVSKTTVATDNGIEPRNIFKAKTIMRKAPGADDPMRAARAPGQYPPGHKLAAKKLSKNDPTIGRFASGRKAKPDMTDYDDGSTD